ARPSPDGKYLLVVRHHRPYSYTLTVQSFPKAVEVWDRSGKVVHTVADLPLADNVPIEGVPTGPRSYTWRPDRPATLVWVEALDDGDPAKKVPHRDRVMTLAAPFTDKPGQLTLTEHRYAGIQWSEKGLALVSDYEREKRRRRVFQFDPDGKGEAV